VGLSLGRGAPSNLTARSCQDAGVDWDGDRYQERFDTLASAGHDVHGEADFVAARSPRSVLDAGCGTGRVAVELARRGIDVVGVDRDGGMLAVARRRAPHIPWVRADLAAFTLARTFDAVVLAGNVPLFATPGTQAAMVACCARHVTPGGVLIAGFQLGRGYELAAYDRDTVGAGLTLAERFATWESEPLGDRPAYAVSVHRRPDR
jgi:SAM-dependent methyltransferase